uniref:Methyltransferase n=1 Tax=viral metagenome TaxID=1070528 RepID=A0A6M3LGM7_9ZZZZ
MVRVKLRPLRGSHLPILLRAYRLTDGPVLELGAGLFSTPVLHALCQIDGRKLVTYENHPQFYEWAVLYQSAFHDVCKVEEWKDVDLTPKWSVAFVDHSSAGKRWRELARLSHAEYVVVHDTDVGVQRKYGYEKAYPLFKYQRHYRDEYPNTGLLSNFHPLDNVW